MRVHLNMYFIYRVFWVAMISSNGFGATATGTLSVSANVINSCTIGTVTGVTFASFNGIINTTINASVNGIIPVTCTLNSSISISLDHGQNFLASNYRRMTDGSSHYIGYQLYSDSGYTTKWGNTTDQPYIGGPVASTGTGAVVNYLVYGQIVNTNSSVPAGSYSDSVGITVTY